MMRKVIWVCAPLGLAFAAIEFGSLSLVDQTEPVISLALIGCGLVIIGVIAQALLRK